MNTGGPAADGGSAVAREGHDTRKTNNNPHFDDCLIAPPKNRESPRLIGLAGTKSCLCRQMVTWSNGYSRSNWQREGNAVVLKAGPHPTTNRDARTPSIGRASTCDR
jgi:hypothetical protein